MIFIVASPKQETCKVMPFPTEFAGHANSGAARLDGRRVPARTRMPGLQFVRRPRVGQSAPRCALNLSTQDLIDIKRDVEIIMMRAHQPSLSAGEPMQHVHFPIDAVLSIIITLEGKWVEVGMIGRQSAATAAPVRRRGRQPWSVRPIDGTCLRALRIEGCTAATSPSRYAGLPFRDGEQLKAFLARRSRHRSA